MHSSISSSDASIPVPASHAAVTPSAHSRAMRAVIALLLLFTFVAFGLELATRWGFRRVSKIERRIYTESVAAANVSHGVSTPNVLVLGNSLMLHAVNVPQLNNELNGKARATRFVIEQTFYNDWYFGIKRLLADGSRPEVMVLGLNPATLVGNGARGEYSAHYLISLHDLPEAAHVLHLGATDTSAYYLAHFSLFYAGRNNLRNFILNTLEPKYGSLLHDLVTMPGYVPPDSELKRISADRLATLNQLCSRAGVKFIYVIPPGFGRGQKPLEAGARAVGVDMFVPIDLDALPMSDYLDGFHVNDTGAQLFTHKLAEKLLPRLPQRTPKQ